MRQFFTIWELFNKPNTINLKLVDQQKKKNFFLPLKLVDLIETKTKEMFAL